MYLKSIIKMALKSIATRKTRFIVTILLFAISLTFFGIGMTSATADTVKKIFNAYPKQEAFGLAHQKFNQQDGQYFDDGFTLQRAGEIEAQFANHAFSRVYRNDDPGDFFASTPIRSDIGNGFVVGDDKLLQASGYKMAAGRLPQQASEMCITELMHQCFVKMNLASALHTDDLTYEDVLGKTLTFKKNLYSVNTFTIVGVIDTKIDVSQYEMVWRTDEEFLREEWDEIQRLKSELRGELYDNYHSMFFVSEAFIAPNFFDERIVAGAVVEDIQVGRQAMSEADLQTEGARVLRFGADRPLVSNEVIIPFSAFYKITQKHFVSGVEKWTDEVILSLIANNATLKSALTQCKVSTPKWNKRKFSVVGVWFDGVYQNGQCVQTFESDTVVFQRANIDVIKADNNTNFVKALLTFLTGDKKQDMPLIEFGIKDIGAELTEQHLLRGSLSATINGIYQMDKVLKGLGSLVGGLFLMFTILMMANFIAATIAAKRKDIGIMRALGTTKAAVFWVFLLEALVAALSAFLLALVGMAGAFYAINTASNAGGVGLINAIQFNVWGVLLTFVIAAVAAVAGCLLPSIRMMKKRPIEIIRNQKQQAK